MESRPPAFVAVVTKMRQWVTEADDPRMVMYRHRDRRRDKNVADICCTVVIHCSSLKWSSLEFLGVPCLWSPRNVPTGLQPTDILPSIDARRLRNHPEFERQTRQIVGQVLTDKAFRLSKKVWRIGGIYWRYL